MSFLRKIDQIGLEPNMTFHGHKRFSTSLGGLLTISLVCIFIAGLVYFGRDIYEKKNPIVISSNGYTSEPESITITPQNFPFWVGLHDKTNKNNLFKNDRVYTLVATMRRQTRFLDSMNIIQLNVTNEIIQMVDCDLNIHFPGLEKDFNGTAYKLAYCLPPGKNLTLNGDFNNIQYDLLQLEFFACFNTTQNNNSCLPQAEIDSKIRNTFVSLNFGEHIPYPKNYTDPMIKVMGNWFTSASTVGQKAINFYLKRTYVNTDQGFIFEDNHIGTYIKVDRIQEVTNNIVPRPGERMIQIGIRMSYNEDYYYRSYLKLQTTLANVGGLFKFFSLIAQLVISVITKTYYFTELINDNFKVREEDEKLLVNPNLLKRHNNHRNSSASLSHHRLIFHKLKGRESVMGKPEMPVFIPKDISEGNKEVLRKLITGNKLKVDTRLYCKICCGSKDSKTKRFNQLYKAGKNLVKQYVDINHLIKNLIESETLKKVVLDETQLVLFHNKPDPNLEDFTDEDFLLDHNKRDISKMVMAFSNLKFNKSEKTSRILEFYDKDIMNLAFES